MCCIGLFHLAWTSHVQYSVQDCQPLNQPLLLSQQFDLQRSSAPCQVLHAVHVYQSSVKRPEGQQDQFASAQLATQIPYNSTVEFKDFSTKGIGWYRKTIWIFLLLCSSSHDVHTCLFGQLYTFWEPLAR